MDRATETTQGIAYYFHGTVRCETCLQIQKQAHELISSRFSGQVVFKPVNYDKPENAHFSRDYTLPCPSLVLVRQKEGKDQDWKLLGQTWDFVHIPPTLDQCIEDETSTFLEAANSKLSGCSTVQAECCERRERLARRWSQKQA